MYENFQSHCNIIQYLNMKMTLFSISDDCRIKFKHCQEKEPKNSARCEFKKKTFFATALTHGDVWHGGDVLLIRLSAVKS